MVRSTGSILGRIVLRTRERLLVRQAEVPLEQVIQQAQQAEPVRGFTAALERPGRLAVIAEFKRRSPSRGPIREDLTPAAAARSYQAHGAAALSVLTEEESFGGSLHDLREARASSALPVLRKDFVVDPYQVWEARAAGADAVLLIVAALDDATLATLLRAAVEAGIEALVEVHEKGELQRALHAGARLLGVNNRDLRTLEVRLSTALELASLIPDDDLAVAESGIRTPADLRRLRDAGYDAFLVGESLLQAPDPGEALEALLRESSVLLASRRPVRGERVFVKVCGITHPDDALAAVAAGADALGFVFWPGSPRRVEVEAARAICRELPPLVLRVGVFVDAPREELVATAEAVGLDVLQLHGSEPPEALIGLPRRVLKAVRVGPGFEPAQALSYLGHAQGLLLDTKADVSPGGTGQPFDWSLVRSVRDRAPFVVLAGGLTPENVAEAIVAVRPDAVDVSSGVESAPGRKDPARVRAFVEAVRRAW